MVPTGITIRALFYSIVLHVAMAALLLLNLNLVPRKIVQPAVDINIVQAVTVDEQQVQQEIDRIREADRQKQEAEQKKQQELEKKLGELQKQTAAVEQKRKTEEKRLADLERKKAEEQKQRELEQQKLAEQKKQQQELERQQKLEEEKKRKAEEEKKRQAEEERKRKEAEAQLKAQMDTEQRARDQGEIARYTARIQAAIQREFNLTGLPPGLSATLRIRVIPGGEVAAVQIERSSGNSVFDQRAELAVKRASPLPVPADTRLFEQMRDIRLPFEP
jgi:colicin import membrane protein